MEGNKYGDLVARWKVDLVAVRARKFFFREDEIPDLEQVVVPELINIPFDPDVPGGATERNFIITVIDRQLLKIKRDRQRDVRRINYESASFDDALVTEKSFFAAGRPDRDALRLDVQEALSAMTPSERGMCQALSEGRSQAEIARLSGRSRAAVCAEVRRLREKLRACGLADSIGAEQTNQSEQTPFHG